MGELRESNSAVDAPEKEAAMRYHKAGCALVALAASLQINSFCSTIHICDDRSNHCINRS